MVELSRGVRCTRSALIALNILFLLIGLVVLGWGIYIKVNGHFSAVAEMYNISEALGKDLMQWTGSGMIAVGIFTACLAIFGCLGAALQNRCFLYAYSILLSLIIFLEFGAVITCVVFLKDLVRTYDSGFTEIFHQAYSYNQTETIKLIENLEQQFKCCGVNGASDYITRGYKIPSSCYPDQSSMFFAQGCAEAVAIWVWNELPLIAGVLGSILFIELFGVISSIVLGVAITHSSNVGHYEKFIN